MSTLYCCGFMFRGNPGTEEVLLIQKLKPAWQAGKLNGIGGKVEPNETPSNTMVREFREETGVPTSRNEWRRFCVTEHRQFDGVVHFFTARWFPSMGEPRSVEQEQVRWVRTHEALWPEHPIIQNLLWLIPMAMDPDHVEAHVIDRSIK